MHRSSARVYLKWIEMNEPTATWVNNLTWAARIGKSRQNPTLTVIVVILWFIVRRIQFISVQRLQLFSWSDFYRLRIHFSWQTWNISTVYLNSASFFDSKYPEIFKQNKWTWFIYSIEKRIIILFRDMIVWIISLSWYFNRTNANEVMLKPIEASCRIQVELEFWIEKM